MIFEQAVISNIFGGGRFYLTMWGGNFPKIFLIFPPCGGKMTQIFPPDPSEMGGKYHQIFPPDPSEMGGKYHPNFHFPPKWGEKNHPWFMLF